MFAHNSAITTAQIPRAGYAPHNEQSALLTERLREIARRHQVCYEVCPEWSIAEGRRIQIGFELELCGVNEHVVENGSRRHPVPRCMHCFRTYGELRQIAEWILPREEGPSRYEIQAFDRALHLAPAKRQRRSEVVVTIVIMHRRDFNRPADDCESRCLKEMRERLTQLGIHEDIWQSDGAREPRAPIYQ